jgi:hypothetical protein
VDVDDVADESTGGPDGGLNRGVVEVDRYHRASQLRGEGVTRCRPLFVMAQVGGGQSEGIEYPFPKGLVIGLADHFLNKQSKDQVVGVGVSESGAGLRYQILVFDESIQIVGRPSCGEAILGIPVDRPLRVVGQPGSLVQQMTNGDRFWKRERREIGRC